LSLCLTSLSLSEGTVMRYAIELVFDATSEEKLTDIIDGLDGVGATPTLLQFDERPHLSLALFESDNPTDVLKKLKVLAKTLRCVPLKFESIGVFQKTGVVFLAPAPTRELLRAHQAVQKIARPSLKKTDWDAADYYCVDDLVFHCTLALRLTPAKMLKAIKWALGAEFPRSVMCEALRLVVVQEGGRGVAQELALYPLKSAKKG
jgi:hypothetical protein